MKHAFVAKATSFVRIFKEHGLKAQVAVVMAAPGLAHAGLGDKPLQIINELSTVAVAAGVGILTICGSIAGYKMASAQQATLRDVAPLLCGGGVAGASAIIAGFLMG
jgi:hypothetical protein